MTLVIGTATFSWTAHPHLVRRSGWASRLGIYAGTGALLAGVLGVVFVIAFGIGPRRGSDDAWLRPVFAHALNDTLLATGAWLVVAVVGMAVLLAVDAIGGRWFDLRGG